MELMYPLPGVKLRNQPDIIIMALTVWGEARGESHLGQQAVAHVILNRFRQQKGYWGKTIRDVCLKRHQFTCWNSKDPNYRRFGAASNTPAWESCVKAVYAALFHPGDDPTNGATYYFNPEVVQPDWATSMKQTNVIGDHAFYKP